jgi:hypothetical protein
MSWKGYGKSEYIALQGGTLEVIDWPRGRGAEAIRPQVHEEYLPDSRCLINFLKRQGEYALAESIPKPLADMFDDANGII